MGECQCVLRAQWQKKYSIGYVPAEIRGGGLSKWRKGADNYYSSESSTLVSRGQRLVLQYTDGSPCSPHDNKRALHHDDASLEPIEPRKDEGIRRKSTTISFHCETDPVMSRPQISYVGTDPDECAYFFEIRSHAACPGAEPAQQGLGPGGVFGVIVVIAILVYFIGGIMYQRSVAHARGWRQLPNYSMWASIGSFFQVSLRDLITGIKRLRGTRVASVRDGILPTMEHRPLPGANNRLHGSRSSSGYYPP